MIDLGDPTVFAEVAADPDPLWVVRIRAEAGFYFGAVYANVVYFSAAHSWGTTMWANSSTSISATKIEWIDEIEHSVRGRDRGGMAEVGTAGFKVYNGTDNYDQILRSNGYYFDGRRVEIYLTRKAETNYARAVPMFSGMIVDSKVAPDYIEFRCETIERIYRAKTPPRQYHADDPTVWVADQIGKSVAGKTIPAVFGHVDVAEGYTLSDTYDDGSVDAGRMVNFCDVSWGGGYGVGGVNDLLFGDAGLKEATGGTAWIDVAAGRSPWVIAGAGESAYFTNPRPTLLYCRMLVKMRSWLLHDPKFVGVTNHIYGCDNKVLGEAYIPAATDSSTDPVRCLMFKIPPIDTAGTVNGASGTCAALEAYFVGCMYPEQDAAKWNADFVTGPYNWRAWGAFIDNGTVVNGFGTYTPGWANATLSSINNWPHPADWEYYPLVGRAFFGYPTATYYDDLSDYSNGFFGVGVGTRDGATACGYLKCLEAALYLKFNVSWPTTGIMADIDGYLDSSGGLYTGTANALVENPAHIMAFLWGEFSKAGDANVDLVEALAVAAGYRAGWKFARQLKDAEDVDNVVGDVAQDALLWSWIDSRGKARVFPMTAPHSADGGIDRARLYCLHKSQVVNGVLTKRELSPATDVKTNFKFRYHHSAALGDYSATLFCRPDDSSDDFGATYEAKCVAAKARFTGGIEYDVEYEMPWICDDATAVAAAKAIVERDTVRRWDIEWEGDLGDVAWELGEPFFLDPTEFIDLPIDLLTTAFRVTGKRVSPDSCRIRFTATEVF